MSTKRVVVTGGSGFVGSRLVRALVNMGHQVKVIDDLSTGALANLGDLQNQVEFIHGDIRTPGLLAENFRGRDWVFHLAANASVPESVRRPGYDFSVNAWGTALVLEAAQAAEVQKIVYTSSAAVYGDQDRLPLDESMVPNPVSPYGWSKLAGEQLGLQYHSVAKVPFVAARLFNAYGLGQRKYVLHDLLRKLIANPNKLEVLGDGNQVRDYLNVDDVAAALIHLAKTPGTEGQAFNLASGKGTRIRDLAELLVSEMELSTEIVYTGQSWQGDIAVLLASVEKLAATGFAPKIELRDGIRNYIAWLTGGGAQ